VESKAKSARAFQLSPAACAVVCNNLFEHGTKGGPIERFAPADSHGSSGLVFVSAGDNSLRVGHDATIVKEYIDVVFGGQQGADVALEHEVWLARALDCFNDLGIGGVNQLANLAADLLLPGGQGSDIGVYAWVGRIYQF
jgi:hypothetical protein